MSRDFKKGSSQGGRQTPLSMAHHKVYREEEAKMIESPSSQVLLHTESQESMNSPSILRRYLQTKSRLMRRSPQTKNRSPSFNKPMSREDEMSMDEGPAFGNLKETAVQQLQRMLLERIEKVIDVTLDNKSKEVLAIMEQEERLQKPESNHHSSTSTVQDAVATVVKQKGFNIQSIEKLSEKGYNLFEDHLHPKGTPDLKFHTPDARSSIDEAIMRKGVKSPFFKEFKTQHRVHIESQMKAIQDALGHDNADAVRACKNLVYSTHHHVARKKEFSGSFSTKKGTSLLR